MFGVRSLSNEIQNLEGRILFQVGLRVQGLVLRSLVILLAIEIPGILPLLLLDLVVLKIVISALLAAVVVAAAAVRVVQVV